MIDYVTKLRETIETKFQRAHHITSLMFTISALQLPDTQLQRIPFSSCFGSTSSRTSAFFSETKWCPKLFPDQYSSSQVCIMVVHKQCPIPSWRGQRSVMPTVSPRPTLQQFTLDARHHPSISCGNFVVRLEKI